LARSDDFFSPRAENLAEIREIFGLPLALAIGVFDGVHLGHRKLLREVCDFARVSGALPVAVTFDPHPRAVLPGCHAPGLLISLAERLRLLRENGMARSVVIPFTAAFSRTAPEAFLDRLLHGAEIAAIGVGAHWRFGAGGGGDVALLETRARRDGWKLLAVPELELDGATVSASSIRKLISSGALDKANRLLGAPYAYVGTVTPGYRVAGTHLDCPTANIVPKAGILLPDGVYAGFVIPESGKRYPAAVNIGVAPTYGRAGGAERRIEAHLLDFSGDLYGQTVRFEPIRFLRAERKFASEAALKAQIAEDVAAIRRLAEENHFGEQH